MLTQKRREEILKIISEKGAVSVSELTSALGASESTVRRDLIFLSNLGKLNKIHGGASITKKEMVTIDDKMSERIQKNAAEKTAIAKYAASQIQNGDFVFIDAGSTTLQMIDFIEADGASFVTNGISHIQKLVARGFKSYILGGEIKAMTEAVVGLVAAKNIHNYNFTKAFLGTNGISLRQGFSTPDPDEAFLKAAAIERSFVSYTLADSSKFGKISTVSYASLDSSCIITDRLTDESIAEKTVVKEVL